MGRFFLEGFPALGLRGSSFFSPPAAAANDHAEDEMRLGDVTAVMLLCFGQD